MGIVQIQGGPRKHREGLKNRGLRIPQTRSDTLFRHANEFLRVGFPPGLLPGRVALAQTRAVPPAASPHADVPPHQPVDPNNPVPTIDNTNANLWPGVR